MSRRFPLVQVNYLEVFMPVIYGLPTSPLISRKTPDSSFIPKDFSEMYQHYYVYVLRLVVRAGIDFGNADDVAQTLFVKMHEKGLLEQYDPNLVQSHGGTARFSTFISGFVLTYLRHYVNRQKIESERTLTLVDQPITVGKDSDHTDQSWVDVHGPVFEEEYSELHMDSFRSQIRAKLAAAHRGRSDNLLDLVALFDAVDAQVEAEGKYSTTDLMEQFKVSRTTIHNWLERMRVEVAKATGNA